MNASTRIPCSVGILTFNSAGTLDRALASVQELDDIIICDGGSTDATLNIAAKYGARIIAQDERFKNTDGSLRDYAGVRNQCLDAARHAWFFYLDSDEEAEPSLITSIRKVAGETKPSCLIYNVSPRIVLDGRRIEYSSNYPGWQKRFFNRVTGARFRKPVHERIAYDTFKYPEGYLNGHWLYFISAADDSAKRIKYAQMEGSAHAGKGRAVFAVRKLATILRISLSALSHALLHPRSSMPLALEWRRVRYQLDVIRFTLRMP